MDRANDPKENEKDCNGYRIRSRAGRRVGACGARGLLFIEAVFLAADRELATRKSHLTTEQAGRIARDACVKAAHPFHFSARYRGDETTQYTEFLHAWKTAEPTVPGASHGADSPSSVPKDAE